MTGSVEILLWLGTGISLSVLCCVVVLMMAKWWPSKAVAVAVDGVDDDERLEMQVKELETAGDLDGVAALLLSAWTAKGSSSSRAVTLAHELSQRYPAEAFQMGCPLQQGNRVLNLAPHDDAGAEVADSAPATPAASTREAHAANAGIDIASERASGEDDERGAEAIAIAEATPSGNDERGGGSSSGETPSPPPPPPPPPTTNTTTTTPWERGWQGPEGFKPPPSSSPSSSNRPSSSSTAANPTVSPSPSRDFGSTSLLPSRKREAEDVGGDLGGEKTVVPRNFTVCQLNAFDGGVPAPVVRGGEIKAKEARPISIALRGVVYDASAGRHLYGPGGEYSEFAGHDISRRVARGIKDATAVVGTSTGTSTGNAPLDDLSLEGLDRFEKMTLRGWEDTFKARGYPRVGKVVTPPPPRLFSRAELRAFDGRSAAGAAGEGSGGGGGGGRETGGDSEGKGGSGVEGEAVPKPVPVPAPAPAPMPAGYAMRPIYMGVREKVFDVSFGGSEFYVEGGPYECLAGRDASRVLAKMSMKPEDIEGVLDYASLNDREEKNLADWVEKLGEGGRGYPVVGWLDIS